MAKGTTWLVLGIGALILWARRGRAALIPGTVDVRPVEDLPMGTTRWVGTRAQVEAGMHQAEADHEQDQGNAMGVLEHWGELFGRFPSPMPPNLLAIVVARESGGSATAVSSDTALAEKGLMQLSRDEARAAGVADPFDAEDSVRGAQQLYRSAMVSFGEPDPESQLVIALLSRSLGLGDTRRLRSTVPVGSETFANRLRAWLEDVAQGKPATMMGRIDAQMWARRVYRGILRAETTMLLGWVAPGADLRVA